MGVIKTRMSFGIMNGTGYDIQIINTKLRARSPNVARSLEPFPRIDRMETRNSIQIHSIRKRCDRIFITAREGEIL